MSRHVHSEWTECRHRNGECCMACHDDDGGLLTLRDAVSTCEKASLIVSRTALDGES